MAAMESAATQSPTTSQIVKLLASCSQPTRTKAVRLLLKWLPQQISPDHSPSDGDLIKIWKGLFFCVWHADKVPYQTDLINKLSSLLESCDFNLALRYFECFLITIRREWSGIDYLRLDKFYLLIRKFMLKSFNVLKKKDWDVESVGRYVSILEKKLFLADNKVLANGVLYHVSEVFIDELGKSPIVKKEAFDMFMMLFLSVLEKSTDRVLVGKVKINVFERMLENGFRYLSGERSEEVEKFGEFVLASGLSDKLFKSASDDGTFQGNRKVLFELQKNFLMLDKDFEKSKIQISLENLGDSNETEKEAVSSDGISDVRPLKKRKKEKKILDLKEKKSPDSKEKKNPDLKKKKSSDSKEKKNPDLKEKKSSDSKERKNPGLKKKKKKTVSEGVTNEENENEAGTEGKSSKKKKKTLTVHSIDSNNSVNNGVVNEENVRINKSKSSKKKKSVLEYSLESNDNDSDLPIIMEKDNDMLDFNECVISNLQKQFEKIAAEEGMKTLPITNKKKRKRAKSASKNVTTSNDDENIEGKSGEKSGKKVRFSMKNNVVWKPQTPMPPQSLRLPPSAAPRGSALKKGVLPGPIKESPATVKKINARGSSVKKMRKNTLKTSPAAKRLRKLQILSP